jgi:hypothetical protein
MLQTSHLNGLQFKNMIISGANNLENNKNMVNALNIFPVPDGDTGTNMSLTMSSAVKEVMGAKDENLNTIADAVANGSLMGARGNSGVILSQIFRGFAKAIKKSESMNALVFANAIMEGSNTAYKAIMKPTEGTILTVIRETGEYAVKIATEDMDLLLFMEEIIKKSNEVLARTPDMLLVLKNAGVVDAGGKGLICIIEGMYHTLRTGTLLELQEISIDEIDTSIKEMKFEHTASQQEITFGYCTEFFIKARDIDGDSYKRKIANMGDSIVVVGDENMLKVHIHTNNPGKILEWALEHGELSKVKIDNMREQHRELYFKAEEVTTNNDAPKKYGIITVAMGEGIEAIFRDLGADIVIEGGQTMNPSTEDIVKSIKKINAENIVILPNNSNIILAANQAKSLSEKNVIVSPTKSIPQGISAMMALDFDKGVEDNTKRVEKAITNVKTGQVTYAVRNSSYDGVNIEEGNILGIANGKIINVGEDALEVSQNILKEMIDKDSSLVSIYYGADTTEEEARRLIDFVEENYPDCEVDMHYGGQPIYYYILSVE